MIPAAPPLILGASVLVAGDLDAPGRVAALVMLLQALAAMDLETEATFIGDAVERLRADVQAQPLGDGSAATLGAQWQAAIDAGARLLACRQALAARGIAPTALRADVDAGGGLIPFAERCADARWRVLVW